MLDPDQGGYKWMRIRIRNTNMEFVRMQIRICIRTVGTYDSNANSNMWT